MSLSRLLSEKRSAILGSWFDAALVTFPQDTSNFIKKGGNPFANPIGHSMRSSFERIFDGLLNEESVGALSAPLDDLIRVRAVQDFTPSQAVSFVFVLKGLIRDIAAQQRPSAELLDELYRLEEKIDSLALAAFDIFMKCREKLYDIKANEVKNMTYRILQRAQKMGVENEDTPGPSDDVANK
ncbi:MAG: RsbRD N-terminal domain-containing protein [Nitrospiraceae bacterium]|nr:RsbRD N-terminal domain-containing protein [Nitrospiraceae bacterium]